MRNKQPSPPPPTWTCPSCNGPSPVTSPPPSLPTRSCTCDSRESGTGAFCPPLGGVRAVAQVSPGPGGEQAQVPPELGRLLEGSRGKRHSPFSGVAQEPSPLLGFHKTTPVT